MPRRSEIILYTDNSGQTFPVPVPALRQESHPSPGARSNGDRRRNRGRRRVNCREAKRGAAAPPPTGPGMPSSDKSDSSAVPAVWCEYPYFEHDTEEVEEWVFDFGREVESGGELYFRKRLQVCSMHLQDWKDRDYPTPHKPKTRARGRPQ